MLSLNEWWSMVYNFGFMDTWFMTNIKWVLGFLLVNFILFVVYIIRMEGKVRYLLKRDAEGKEELKIINVNLIEIKEKLAVILDRQERES